MSKEFVSAAWETVGILTLGVSISVVFGWAMEAIWRGFRILRARHAVLAARKRAKAGASIIADRLASALVRDARIEPERWDAFRESIHAELLRVVDATDNDTQPQ